jgi:heat shock protein HslJ
MDDRPQAPARTLDGTLWRLVATVDADGVRRSVPHEVRATARLDEATISGVGGCNRYSGGYELAGRSLTFRPVASTMMACSEPAMSVEGAFFAALGRVAAWEIGGDALALRDAAGSVVLEFAAVDEPSLTGTAWRATGINDGRGAVSGPVAGTAIGAEFGEDGTLTGSSGCNRYRGTFRSDGHAILIGPLATTRMACPEPLMEQEARYLAALGRASRHAIDGDTLELRDDAGALEVAFEATGR